MLATTTIIADCVGPSKGPTVRYNKRPLPARSFCAASCMPGESGGLWKKSDVSTTGTEIAAVLVAVADGNADEVADAVAEDDAVADIVAKEEDVLEADAVDEADAEAERLDAGFGDKSDTAASAVAMGAALVSADVVSPDESLGTALETAVDEGPLGNAPGENSAPAVLGVEVKEDLGVVVNDDVVVAVEDDVREPDVTVGRGESHV